MYVQVDWNTISFVLSLLPIQPTNQHHKCQLLTALQPSISFIHSKSTTQLGTCSIIHSHNDLNPSIQIGSIQDKLFSISPPVFSNHFKEIDGMGD